MKIFKRIVTTITIIIIISIIISCSSINNENNVREMDDIVAASLITQYNDSYYFILKNNNKLIVSVKPLKEEGNGQIETKTYESILTEDKSKDIIKVLNEMGDFRGEINTVYDAWVASIKYKGKESHFTYGLSKNRNYDILITKLIQYSPIQIVDRYGLIVKPIKSE